ncbi:MAG TPA: four-helix bundle copper-binding protein [bacterium]|nr:four-helix bundle copper-binding protein [bacterium]
MALAAQALNTIASPEMQACIEACLNCALACEICADTAIPEGKVDCARYCRDCAEVCKMAASWMARSSAFHLELCQLCAFVCDLTANECGKHNTDHCQVCMRACTDCAEKCHAMAAAAGDRLNMGTTTRG